MRSPAAVFAFALVAACDSSATLYPVKLVYREARLLSAHPAVDDGTGRLVRACGEDAAGATELLVDLALLSSNRDDEGILTDLDVGIRPGDIVEAHVVGGEGPNSARLAPATLGFSLDGLEAISTSGGDAGGAAGPTPPASLEEVAYVARAPERRAGIDVVVLVDASGSVGGMVDAESLEEGDPGTFSISNEFGQLASDAGDVRLTAAKRLVAALNVEDRVAVELFRRGLPFEPVLLPPSEGLLQVPSQADEEDRSNLWESVVRAREFLAAGGPSKRAAHVVVVTDGPDTCGPGHVSAEAVCSSAGAGDLRTALEEAATDPAVRPVSIHFVQFESPGYRGPDPRQIEVACLSGGHHVFVDSEDLPKAQSTLLEALEQASTSIRYGLAGHWELALAVPSLPSVRRGSLHALSGTLSIRAASKLVPNDRAETFTETIGPGAPSAGAWDRRPLLRLPCSGASDCSGAPSDGPPATCDPPTLLCASAE